MLWVRRLISTSSFSSKDYPMLGRWTIQYSDNVINRKIDQANEDHCGCCQNEPTSTMVVNHKYTMKLISNSPGFQPTKVDDEYYKPFLY